MGLLAEVIRVEMGSDAATWVVAAATVALFGATGLLFWATSRMVRTSARQVDIGAKRAAAAQRPHVYPVTLDPWVAQEYAYANGRAREVIPVANAGAGIAHNVTGMLKFAEGGVFVPLIPVTLQPG